ncbi:MAG: DUF3035 domain-containing protein [Magnetovibrio sp.]|nr:DUF3035 domain-containing protein [Magnetovibrio sp.]
MKRNFAKRLGTCLAVAALAVAVAGCESARKAIGGAKTPPDEFVVYKRPPLSLPPNYGLRAPKPGSERPQLTTPTEDARRALLGQRNAPSGQSGQKTTPGLQALLRDTGADRAEPNIRRTINEETSVLAQEDQIFVNKLIFWVDDTQAPATTVDAKKEQQRIMENKALGKPITEGETPQIKRKQKRKGLLNF